MTLHQLVPYYRMLFDSLAILDEKRLCKKYIQPSEDVFKLLLLDTIKFQNYTTKSPATIMRIIHGKIVMRYILAILKVM